MNKKTRQGTKTLIFIFSSSAGAETSQPTRFPQLMWSHRRMRRKSEYTWPFLCRLVVMSLWSVSLTTTGESLVKSLILVSVKVCCFIRNTSDMTQICCLVFADKCGDVFLVLQDNPKYSSHSLWLELWVLQLYFSCFYWSCFTSGDRCVCLLSEGLV